MVAFLIGNKGRAGLLHAVLPALFFVCTGVLPAAEDLEAKSRRAKSLLESGRFEEAIPICKELVAALPGNPGLVLNLGLAEHMAGHEKEAITAFEAVLKTQPKALPALVSLGAARLSLKQPGLSVSPLQRALAVDPNNQDARGMLAASLNATGQLDASAREYRKLTELSPYDPRAWHGLGITYQAIASDAFERLRKANPQSGFVASLLADTRVQKHQYRSAFYFFSEALKQLPAVHGIHPAMAEVYRKTGHPDWAATEDAREQAMLPAVCPAHPGECQFLAGHDLEALELPKNITPEALYWRAKAANELSLQSLVRLGQLPPSPELHQVRAEIARDQNQPLEAIKEWRAALALAPGNPGLQRELAISCFLANDYRTAVTEIEKSLLLEPRAADLNFALGDSWLHLEDPEKAVPYLRTALVADPKMLAADASLGLSLSRLGKFAEAVPHLEKARELDEDGSLNYQLGRAWQAAGNAAAAKTAMARYEEIQKLNQKQKEEAALETRIIPPQ